MFVRDSATPGRPTLLLLHGFPTAGYDWHALWDALVPLFRCVAPDLLGFGFSDKPPRHAYGIGDQAERIEDLLSRLDAGAVHVLAHDLGDSVAQELLARDLERRDRAAPGLRIASICFLNGGLFPEAHRPRPIQRLLAGPLGPLLVRALDARRFARSFAAVFGSRTPPGAALLDDCWALVSRDQGHRLAPRLLGYMAERRVQRARWLAAMRRGAAPLRLVDGLADPVSGARLVARYRELLPDADVVELPDIGHYPQLEAPQAVLCAAQAFWHRIGLGAGG
jgi:pimeloyl-ACP methyl ester carboxylesterase